MRWPTLFFIWLLFVCGSAAARDASLTELLTEHSVQNLRIDRKTDLIPLLVLKSRGPDDILREKLIKRVVEVKLKKSHLTIKTFEGDYMRALISGHLSPPTVLAPKLIIEIAVDPEKASSRYSVAYQIALVEYQNEGAAFKAKIQWQNVRELSAASAQESEEALLGFLEKDLASVIKPMGSLRHEVNALDGEGISSRSYQVQWNDPNHRRSHLFSGLSIGTPSLVNLHVGYWGNREFPLVAGLSGMYYGTARRGIQLDLGWAYDNSGPVRQVFGVALLAVNATSISTNLGYDDYGRVISSTVDTTNRLAPYVGPTYTIDWNSFRVQGGAALRSDSGSGSPAMFLIQLGYLPSIF